MHTVDYDTQYNIRNVKAIQTNAIIIVLNRLKWSSRGVNYQQENKENKTEMKNIGE